MVTRLAASADRPRTAAPGLAGMQVAALAGLFGAFLLVCWIVRRCALADDRRALATDADDWQPLRIAVDYSSIDNATTLATIQDLVPYATAKLASALRVRKTALVRNSKNVCLEYVFPRAHI